ncbi:3-oxoacyl-[acyl-carrier-protein] synthase III [Alteromonas sp. 76-1]|uniref:3-oxoacyl-[acyl-carrier-protein] synthase III C-terminal domain-containing protein n=1 Tax=Alteromonas sp. 76-1 TaxID=2358187 RepID=UPI000FD15F9B|nr:3-oxoacyl-[acyl-carrier-protein] synthase III C-terminal domain-containing protein [Alteromonas sp. 76-1]VEL98343.1 3-oxoacyl-[acyl-carrier-protein] synthase III [Alteromonas sp. 76-1]
MNWSTDKSHQVGISAIHFEGGNRVEDIESITNAKEKFKAVSIPLNKKLLGSNSYLRNDLSLHEFITIPAKKTLQEFSQMNEPVDMVIFASANLAHIHHEPSLVCQMLKTLNIEQAIPIAVTLQECTSLLAAIDIARMYIQCQSYKNILVISFDQISVEDDRVKSFGVISDAVSSCIVRHSTSALHQIMCYENGYDIKGANGKDDFNSRKQLSQRVTQNVLSKSGATINDITKVFTTNFYKPVTQFSADTLSLKKEQVYNGTAMNMAHCVCSDPLINFAHYLKNEEAHSGALYLLQSYAPGFMASMVIRAN